MLINELVHDDIRKADVLNNYQIDICCRANRPLDLACQEKGIDTKLVIEEINQIRDDFKYSLKNTFNWSLDLIIEYILVYHHFYLWQELPKIEKLLEKLVKIHSEKHPQLIDLVKYFTSLRSETELHMANEEQTLFPYINELLLIQEGNKKRTHTNSGSINTTLTIMKMEHETTANILKNIRLLCHDYNLKTYICNSHQLVLEKLKVLEMDLYQHIYLENEVLFPKALKLEKEILPR